MVQYIGKSAIFMAIAKHVLNSLSIFIIVVSLSKTLYDTFLYLAV